MFEHCHSWCVHVLVMSGMSGSFACTWSLIAFPIVSPTEINGNLFLIQIFQPCPKMLQIEHGESMCYFNWAAFFPPKNLTQVSLKVICLTVDEPTKLQKAKYNKGIILQLKYFGITIISSMGERQEIILSWMQAYMWIQPPTLCLPLVQICKFSLNIEMSALDKLSPCTWERNANTFNSIKCGHFHIFLSCWEDFCKPAMSTVLLWCLSPN